VTLPPKFNYQVDFVDDSFAGRFSTKDGNVVVRHDIGGYAGVWARQMDSSFAERFVNGARVWTTHGAVTFPDSGCANFYLEKASRDGAVAIRQIAASFRPKQLHRSHCSLNGFFQMAPLSVEADRARMDLVSMKAEAH
jgi:hypothetical protein